jgi:quercetin dioxygenase-like cupin family protein/type 1 glutamine amidotransferase
MPNSGSGPGRRHAAGRVLPLLALLAACIPVQAGAEAATRRIVLIGGAKSEGPAQHDYPNGVRVLEAILESSPDLRAIEGLVVDAWPDGWPRDRSAFADAATIVWYFDGLERHPLLDAARRAEFAAVMLRGVGLVALHQSTTVPPGDTTIGLDAWVGGSRDGMFDRTTEMAELVPAPHPVANGVGTFTYHDEFYPTIRNAATGRVTPVLSGNLHVQFREGRHLVIGEPVRTTVAWTYERDGGGRAFGFSGAHYLVSLDEPALRRLLLNAIFWTAGIDLPADGVRSGLPDASRAAASSSRRPPLTEAVVTRSADHRIVEFPWGRLTWHASGELGNSDTLTVGQAVIRPGQSNSRHYHPNCDEVLHVLKGRIRHAMGDRTVEMGPGDTVTIPTGILHNATNIGDEDAVLAISFSTADRQVVNE